MKAAGARSIEATKKVQTLLGEIHDCDVWRQQSGAFRGGGVQPGRGLFGNVGRFDRLKPGIDYLRKERDERRGRSSGSWSVTGRS